MRRLCIAAALGFFIFAMPGMAQAQTIPGNNKPTGFEITSGGAIDLAGIRSILLAPDIEIGEHMRLCAGPAIRKDAA